MKGKVEIPQQKFEQLVICSERYLMGHTSSETGQIITFIMRNLESISTETLKILVEDFRAVRKQQIRFEMYQEAEKKKSQLVNVWGGKIMEARWRALWTKCRTEIAKRKEGEEHVQGL